MTLAELPSRTSFRFLDKHLNTYTIYWKLCENKFAATSFGKVLNGNANAYDVLYFKNNLVEKVK